MKLKNRKALNEFYNIIKYDIGVFIGLFLLVLIIHENLKYNDVKDVVGTLQNISAAVFTIVGLWVGFLYPTAIQGIVSDNIDYIKNTKDVPRIEKLIYVIIVSALVMLGTLLFYFLKSLIGNSTFYMEYKAIVKIASFSFVYCMCWLQVRCVVSVIVSNIRFAANLHSKISTSRIEHDE